MLRLAGPVRGNAIRVYSFTRLAEAVFRQEGGAVGRRLTDGGRRILMASALEACQDRLELYAGAAKSGRAGDLMLDAVNEMKMCGVSRRSFRPFPAGWAAGGWEEALGAGAGVRYIRGPGGGLLPGLPGRPDPPGPGPGGPAAFLRGALWRWTPSRALPSQEMRVLVQIMRRAQRVVVALCTDGLDRTGTGLFALVDRTRHRLAAAAQEWACRWASRWSSPGRPWFQNENPESWWRPSCSAPRRPSPRRNSKGITVFEARDPYEEAEFAAATIRRLVMEEGFRYRSSPSSAGTPPGITAACGGGF